ncbi:hypothetical protein WJX73_005452 [Symbiochloris irregularis]|uniref:Peptidase M20 dimerisation domain-containing protein n=1 Tax=Symbiochloris irregularis TaxID=706552 RepID=A0AAW1NPS0_9CHLO
MGAATNVMQGCEPAEVWSNFERLSQLPRPSKHEARVQEFLKDFAAQRKLKHSQDKAGNIVIFRPGSGGGGKAPPVIIQGHIDMVTEKDSGVEHDFFKDPIKLQRSGDWLQATGTTLGADNGLGVAAALALLSQPQSAKLPPLECLFTVDEETGLTGAFDLDASMLTGRTMLNLDTEDWGEIFIGCAGGGDSEISLTAALEPAPAYGFNSFEVQVSKLMGGHSGLNIGEDRGNAIIIAAQVTDSLMTSVKGTRLAEIRGGDKRNAIPREACATLLVPSQQTEEVRRVFDKCAAAFRDEFGSLEKDMSITLNSGSAAMSMRDESSVQLLNLLCTLPHGVVKYSHDVPGLVETSTNLASVKLQAPTHTGPLAAHVTYSIVCCTRSSLMPALENVRQRIAKTARLCGASIALDKAYPGWKPCTTSKVLDLTKSVIGAITGQQPKVGAIHAGLECGIIGEKIPGIDMVSYGPTIKGAHSPQERVLISTVQPFWQATVQILQRLADAS